jgi:hypothetical protein
MSFAGPIGEHLGALAVSFSNGIIASIPREHFCWEVSDNANNHILLPRPCVGFGTFEMDKENTNLELQHTIACCSRDGSVIIVPTELFSTSKESCASDIIRYQIPCDVDGEDDSIRYVQGFTAGYIRTRTRHEKGVLSDQGGKIQPLFFRALTGGLIDVYACTSVKGNSSSCSKSQQTCSETELKMEFATCAVKTLLSLNPDEEEIQSNHFKTMIAALDECTFLGNNVEDIAAKLCQNGIQHYPSMNKFINALLLGEELISFV